MLTHPVTNFWVEDVPTSAPGSKFFSAFAAGRSGNWTALRNSWELSHVVRACLSGFGLIAIAVATSLLAAAG
jgi:hypothetical protein